MALDIVHYKGDEYVGKVEEKVQIKCRNEATKIEGKAGDICLMHTWSLHGGTANLSKNPRRMLIADLTAGDNWPLMPPMVPSIFSGKNYCRKKLLAKYVFVKLNLNYQNIINQILFLVLKAKKVNKKRFQ